jgi:hypothetical protein
VGRPYNTNGGREDPKKGFKWNLPQQKPVGRPRTRWADVVQRDALQLLGVSGWRRRAENREAKARKGL